MCIKPVCIYPIRRLSLMKMPLTCAWCFMGCVGVEFRTFAFNISEANYLHHFLQECKTNLLTGSKPLFPLNVFSLNITEATIMA